MVLVVHVTLYSPSILASYMVVNQIENFVFYTSELVIINV